MSVENIDIAEAARRKSANRRVAIVLASVTCVFFFGIIAARFIGGPTTGISVMGAAVLLFLVVAIGRNLGASEGRKGRRAQRALTGGGGQPQDDVDASLPAQGRRR